MEIVYVYQKMRTEMGKHCEFKDAETTLGVEILPNVELQEQYMEKNPSGIEMDCVPMLSEHSANTLIKEYKDRGMVHQEGGWPKDIDPTEPDQKIRYIKKAEKDEDYIKTMDKCVADIEHSMRQNAAVDIYEDYFGDATGSHQGSFEGPGVQGVT